MSSREQNARFISRAYVGSVKAELIDHWCVLQAKTPGNCQLTVKQAASVHDVVALELGWGSAIDRVFIGYVERVIPSDNGYYTLFCRELSAALSNNISVVLRHPTLRQVVSELETIMGLEFVLPNKPYVDTAIPCFYADTSGYAMLDNIGRAFNIPDFIWQQQGNGKIYLGSYQDSFWQGRNITIPTSLLTQHSAANAATLPAAPKIRPNVMANDKRISKVEFKDTHMTITW